MRFGILVIGAAGCVMRLAPNESGTAFQEVDDPAVRKIAERVEVQTVLDTQPGPLVCPDTVLSDQSKSLGNLNVTYWQPCYPLYDNAREAAQKETAADQRAEQASEQLARRSETSEALVEQFAQSEPGVCAGIPIREREQSPFSDQYALQTVEPMTDDGQLVGVRVVFKEGQDLDADAMQREIECHRARWAVVDNPAGWVPNDPTMIEGAKVDVVERAGRVEVIVTAPTPDVAETALMRAQGRMNEQRGVEQTARR